MLLKYFFFSERRRKKPVGYNILWAKLIEKGLLFFWMEADSQKIHVGHKEKTDGLDL